MTEHAASRDNADPKDLLELAVRLAAEAGRILIRSAPRTSEWPTPSPAPPTS